MARISWRLGAVRSEDEKPRTLRLSAHLTVDLDWWHSHWALRNGLTVLCLSLVVLSFFFSFASAAKLRMHKEVSLVVVSTIPPALSRVAYGHDRRYMSLNFVHESFNKQLEKYAASDRYFRTTDLNRAIANILTENPVAVDRSDRVLPADDKGMVVVTEAAFRLFGYRVEGVFYLYYLILGISAALFAYAYWRNPSALLLLAAFLLLHRMVLPMIKYDPALISLTTLRCIPVLAMIACMHCVLFLFESKVDLGRLFAVVAQVAIIVFVLHLRTSAIWVLGVVVAASLAFVLLRKGPIAVVRSEGTGPFSRWPAAVPLVAAITFMLILNAHRAYGFPDPYHRDEMVTRPVWLSILMGLVHNPRFAKRFDPELRIDDVTAILAVKKYLLESGRDKEWEAMGSNTRPLRWEAVDRVARELLFVRCREYFKDCMAAILYYKPLSMIKTVLWVCGLVKAPPDIDVFVSQFDVGTAGRDEFLETSRQLDIHKARGPLWARGLLVIAAVFTVVAILRRNKKELIPVIATAALLALGSTATSIIGFPAPHTITEAAIAIPLLFVLLASYLLARIIAKRK